jgi:hypothetical protein
VRRGSACYTRPYAQISWTVSSDLPTFISSETISCDFHTKRLTRLV